MPDDLRTALHDAVTDAHNTGVTDLGELVDDFVAPCVAEYIADPVRRLAILNLIGDVREGVLIEPTDFTMWSVRPAISGVTLWPSVPVFVVRPRGEAIE